MYCFAGIVLYNPDIVRLQQSIKSIEGQVEGVILVDNGSSNIEEVESLIQPLSTVWLIKNLNNLGIATALNQISSFALEKGAEWVLTLDQDTICHEGMVLQLTKYANHDRVGILCPTVDYEGLNIKNKRTNSDCKQVRACMTSGSLTNLLVWKEVGGFRDDYFIDYVDNEYCMKLETHHYKILRVRDCIMHHQLGDAKDVKILGVFKKRVSTHRPWRYYYMTRNNLVFIWDYKSHLCLVKEYLKLVKILFNGMLYSDEKKETARYVWEGILDAKNRKMGRLDL